MRGPPNPIRGRCRKALVTTCDKQGSTHHESDRLYRLFRSRSLGKTERLLGHGGSGAPPLVRRTAPQSVPGSTARKGEVRPSAGWPVRARGGCETGVEGSNLGTRDFCGQKSTETGRSRDVADAA